MLDLLATVAERERIARDLHDLLGHTLWLITIKAALASRVLERDPEDVLLTDIEMPHLSGLEVAAEVRRLRLPTRVVILTTFARSGYLRRALEAGAAGYLLKDSPPDMLANAVRRAHAGLRAIDPQLAAEAWTEPDPLPDRERQALRFAGDGKTSADIAASLGLSEGTVRNYISEAMAEMHASTRIEAARIAREKGWLIDPRGTCNCISVRGRAPNVRLLQDPK